MKYSDLTLLINNYGHWCRRVGYLDAASRTPIQSPEVLADLKEAREEMNQVHRAIDKYRSDDLTEQVRVAQQSSANVFQAAIAGIEVGKREAKQGAP